MKKLLSLVAILGVAFALSTSVGAAVNDTYYSDVDVTWSDTKDGEYVNSVLTYVHPSWPSIDDAKWIWRNEQTTPSQEDIEDGYWFKKEFEIPLCAENISGKIFITTDNWYTLYLNGSDKDLGSDGTWQNIEEIDISPEVGANTVLINAKNYYSTGTYTSNPAGLLFKIEISYSLSEDCDKDEVLDSEDMCLDTKPDVKISENLDYEIGKFNTKNWEKWGQNRWLWTEDGWKQYFSNKKEGIDYREGDYDTCGCSAYQILDELSPVGNTMLGHWKFGLSSSLVEEFSLDCQDGLIDGWYLVDTVSVPGNNEGGKDSTYNSIDGLNYKLEASGTYTFAKYWTVGGIADAMYSLRPTGLWVLGSELTGYIDYLRLRVNGNPVDWTLVGAFENHTYNYDFLGDGNKIHFNIFDGGTISDNAGSLTVKIYAKL